MFTVISISKPRHYWNVLKQAVFSFFTRHSPHVPTDKPYYAHLCQENVDEMSTPEGYVDYRADFTERRLAYKTWEQKIIGFRQGSK